MDKFARMREQNDGLRSDLGECQRGGGELADEVARLDAKDSRVIMELDRVKRDRDRDRERWRDRVSVLQSQLIDAKTELGSKEECRRLQNECQRIKETVGALNTQEGWRQRQEGCRNENWRLQGEVGVLKKEKDAKPGELDTVCEEVGKAKVAEANQRDRAREIEEELARVRIASARKVNEEDVAFREAFPFLFQQVEYLKEHCRKPFDKRRPYPGHCPNEGSRNDWRYYCLLCSSVGSINPACLKKALSFPVLGHHSEVAPGFFAGPNGLEGRHLQRLGRGSDEVAATDPASPA
jgi:hypothetical protein